MGVLDKNQAADDLISIVDWLFSKSSMYEVPVEFKSIDFGCPGIKWANSPTTEKVDFSLVSIKGILSIILVINLESVEYAPFSPHIVLEIGSSPILIF